MVIIIDSIVQIRKNFISVEIILEIINIVTSICINKKIKTMMSFIIRISHPFSGYKIKLIGQIKEPKLNYPFTSKVYLTANSSVWNNFSLFVNGIL